MLHAVGNKYKTPDNLISILSTFQLMGKDYCVLITVGDATDITYKGFNGNRYSDPIPVEDPYNVTRQEMDAMTRGKAFELYTHIVTI